MRPSRTGATSGLTAASSWARVTRSVAVFAALTLVLAAGCFPATASPRPSRSLSPDSIAMLDEALRHVRPAFPTQEEALRAGLYQHVPVATALRANDREMDVIPPQAAAAAGAYVIQIAAYRDRALADRAAAEAQRRFPQALAVVEVAGEVYRVGLAGWESAPAATAELPEIQRVYPGAWVRRRGVS